MTKILALDCATKTGYALVVDGQLKESGVQDFSKKRGESNGILFLRFRKWIDVLVDLTKPEVLAYERAHFRGGAATELCVGLQTRVQESAALRDVPCLPITTSSVKKFATGSGRASKQDMLYQAAIFLNRQPIDDNEADAVLLAMFANSEV